MESRLFVPSDFVVPLTWVGPTFSLRPLTVEDNERDLDAWATSVEHIHATPGFERRPWPDDPMTLERNGEDLAAHAEDFAARRGFTYTVEHGDQVIGCVYIYPTDLRGVDAHVRSWVRSSHADQDDALYAAVNEWLRQSWPFEVVEYAARG